MIISLNMNSDHKYENHCLSLMPNFRRFRGTVPLLRNSAAGENFWLMQALNSFEKNAILEPNAARDDD